MFTLNEVIGIVLGALSAFAGIIYLYFKDFYGMRQNNANAKKKESEILSIISRIIDPANHQFFVKIKFYINNESWHLGIDENNECCTHVDIEQCLSEPKKNIMSDMLKAKLSYWYCGYRELFFGRTKFNEKRVRKTVVDIIDRYEKEWVQIGVPLYIQEQFKRKHKKRADGISRLMDEIFKKSENKLPRPLGRGIVQMILKMRRKRRGIRPAASQ
jgi:hypothetical protein